MLASELKEAASQYWVKKRRAVHFELGLCRRGRLRADVMSVSMRGDFILGEVKSSARDFLSDKKWPSYLEYCNRLFFILDNPTYLKIGHKIPKGIGIMVVYPLTDGRKRYKTKIVQRSEYRELDDEIWYNLTMRMVFRSADRNRYKVKNV